MLYVLSALGLLGDVIAIWLAIHSRKHERKNNQYLSRILSEVHEIVVVKKER